MLVDQKSYALQLAFASYGHGRRLDFVLEGYMPVFV